MKKALILSVTAGNGHNACAKAVKTELQKRGVEVKVVDLIKDFSTKMNAWICNEGYALAFSRLPQAYGYFYDKYRKSDPKRRYVCSAQGVANSTLKGLLKLISEYRPDVIFSTHFYGAIALTNLKLLYNLPCKCFATALDYVRSPFWESGVGLDYLAITNEEFLEEYLSLGFTREQLLPVGIPVDGRTLTPRNKQEMRAQLGLDENSFTLLVAFGGGLIKGGFKNFKNVLAAADGKQIQVAVINGKDKKSYDKIEKLKKKSGVKILNVGFTDDVPAYLACADLAVCKAGGLSSTEMINSGLPLLITGKLPAQEKYNLEYLIDKGVADSYRSKKELKEKIARYYDDRSALKTMADNTLPLRCNALEELVKVMVAQPTADYSDFAVTDSDLKSLKKRLKAALKLANAKERNK